MKNLILGACIGIAVVAAEIALDLDLDFLTRLAIIAPLCVIATIVTMK